MRAKRIESREKEILNGIVEILKKYLDPERIILFGSRTKENFYKNADFDIAVDNKKVDIRKTRKIMEAIEEVAGLYSCDLVFLGSVEKDFRNIILNTGKVIYERGRKG